MANKIQLTISADDQASGPLAKVKDSLGGVGEAGKKSSEGTKAAGISLTDLKSGIDMAIGAFNAFKDAAEAAFNFAAEGAAINQTKASFEGLGLSIDALRQASNGTVDDMTLMAGSLTLMAGATGEVQAHFADATPQLMEMAKAASKLNPTLGDTSFMFSSIATAAKRQSAMIADNLGIVVKQEDAYQKYADSIGVAVTQLTAEQKQIAFLNGLLEAGNVLLEQAGSNTESAADGYAVLTTTIKNMTDEMKANVSEGIGPLTQRFSLFMKAANETDANLHSLAGNIDFLKTMFTGSGEVVETYSKKLRVQAAASERAAGQAQRYAEEQAVAKEATEQLTVTIDPAIQAALEYEDALQGAVWPTRVLAEATMATTRELDLFKGAIGGELGNEIEQFKEKEGELIGKSEELRAKIEELEKKQYLTAAQKQELETLRGELGNSKQAISDNAAAHEEATKRILFGFMEQRLAMDGLTQAELMALQEVAGQWGLIDQATLSAMKGIDGVATSFESGKTPIDEFGAQLAEIGIILSGLPREHTFVMNYVETGAGPGGYSGWKQQAENREQMYAEGGLVASSGLALVGEEGPEFVHLPAGSRVVPADRTRQMQQNGGMGDGGVLINVQATINNGMDAELWANRIAEIAGQRTRSRAMGVV